MDAILYAAGRGVRLGPLAAECPKILIEVGGRTLLERHAELLAWAGVERLHVVTGHLRETVAREMESVTRRTGFEILEIFNSAYTEGSVISMAASLPLIRRSGDSILLLDGDVLYDHRLMARLVNAPSGSTLLIDRGYSTADDDPVLVPIVAGKPVEFRKKWVGQADVVGESIGFFKMDRAGMEGVIRETEARLEGERRRESYDEVIRALVLAGGFGFDDVTGLPWTEIDFPEDIAFANESVLPRLESVPDHPARRIAPHDLAASGGRFTA
ncbi:MAG: NTP transferase domain-containing protein [Limisphaerales bacterium]